MKKATFFNLALAAAFLLFVAGCTGPRGPAGPAGPQGAAGPGTQTTYFFRITPTVASGTYSASCPSVVADNTGLQYSTVACYLHFDGWDDAPLVPFTDTEADATTTKYFYAVEQGTVILGWINSASTIPAAFDLVVTVVNQ
ncbi:hypothetical protein JW933_11760 [candidate division FCPU426 bacterium]|nr:hypothetical protein [candidate division FCPU426 bacterium]